MWIQRTVYIHVLSLTINNADCSLCMWYLFVQRLWWQCLDGDTTLLLSPWLDKSHYNHVQGCYTCHVTTIVHHIFDINLFTDSDIGKCGNNHQITIMWRDAMNVMFSLWTTIVHYLFDNNLLTDSGIGESDNYLNMCICLYRESDTACT